MSSSYALFASENFPKMRFVSEHNKKQQRKNDAKIYIIDIDGTICDTIKSDYYNSIPIRDNIDIFNNLYDTGNEVHYWTARGANSRKIGTNTLNNNKVFGE